MGTIHYFLAIDGEHEAVLQWFKNLPDPPEMNPAGEIGVLLNFSGYGGLSYKVSDLGTVGQLDAQNSPLVSVFLPIQRRGVLWTAGEIHFLPTPMRKVCPPLVSINRRFKKWLRTFDRVFAVDPTWDGKWDYQLEGTIRNTAPEVFALPIAMNALRQGQYFVAEHDNDMVLDKVCRSLRLRGINCAADA